MGYSQYDKKKAGRQARLHFLTDVAVEDLVVRDHAQPDHDEEDVAEDGVEWILHGCKSDLYTQSDNSFLRK